jgi:hypothetical protein
MSLRLAGFFRELQQGLPDGPGLRESCRATAQPDEAMIAGYLEAGAVIRSAGARVDDVLDPARTSVASMYLVTDGTWVWPLELAYYIREYHVELPADFVAHMRAQSWKTPGVTDAELIRLSPVLRELLRR